MGSEQAASRGSVARSGSVPISRAILLRSLVGSVLFLLLFLLLPRHVFLFFSG